MKRLMSLILLLLLLANVFTGCSTKNDQKSEEELREEIRAELEAEAKVKEEQEQKSKETNQETTQTKSTKNTVNASNLKEGDMIDGHVIKKLGYKAEDEFSIELGGEFTVNGEITFDTEYYYSLVLSIDKDCSLPTTIEFKFDEVYQVRPPLGLYKVEKDNLDILKSKIGISGIENIKNGNKLQVELIVDGYGFYAKNHTESFSRLNIKKIINSEFKNQTVESNLNKDALLESDKNYYKFKSNTYVYFDIDMDGINEEIKYDSANEKLIVTGYDPIDIIVDQSVDADSFIIINFSDKYSTRMNMIGIFDWGASADPVTTLYSIIAPQGPKSLVSVGKITGMIVPKSKYNDPYKSPYDFKSGSPTDYLSYSSEFMEEAFLIEGEGIEAPVTIPHIIPQTWFGRALYTYDSTDCYLVNHNENYDEDYKTFAVLKSQTNVKVYAQKDSNSESNIIRSGQNVLLYATDSNEWIAMQAADGTKGWVHISDVTHENFEGFAMFG